MAFPGTYNINYYKGDTLEFRVYPKDSTGDPFPLSQYVSPNGTTKFTIAPSRGASTGLIEGYAEISNDQTFILCAITPANGALMTAGTTYVYDVEIARADAPYDFVYTLLTGTVSVTEQVTPYADIEPPETIPSNPTGLEATVTNNSITATWTAPTTGGTPTTYKVYILPYTTDIPTITAKILSGPDDTVSAPTTTYTFTELDPETQYLVGIISSNSAGDATGLPLSNLGVPITTNPDLPDNPTDLVASANTPYTIDASWTEPAGGGTVEEYNVYILPYTTDPLVIGAAFLAGPIDTTEDTEYTFVGLTPETGYLVGIQSSNITGDAELETILTNLLSGPIVTPSEES